MSKANESCLSVLSVILKVKPNQTEVVSTQTDLINRKKI